VAPAGRSAKLDDATRALCDRVRAALEQAAFQPPAPDELAARLSARPADLARAFEALADEGSVIDVGKGLNFAAARIEEARAAIVENCGRNQHLEIPQLRDRLSTTRKWLIPLLEYFDVQGLTIRQGANRILRRR